MQAGEVGKFRKNSEIFARIEKFSLCIEISLHSEIFTCSEMFCFMFLCTNDPVFCFFHLYPHYNDTIKDKMVFSPFCKAI